MPFFFSGFELTNCFRLFGDLFFVEPFCIEVEGRGLRRSIEFPVSMLRSEAKRGDTGQTQSFGWGKELETFNETPVSLLITRPREETPGRHKSPNLVQTFY